MKQPSVKSIIVRNAPDSVAVPLGQLNSFLQEMCNGLNKNITLTENLRCQIKTVSFTTPSTYTTTDDFVVFGFPKSFSVKALGVLLLGISIVGSTDVIYEPVTLQWSERDGEIRINFVTGLANNTTYSITMLVL